MGVLNDPLTHFYVEPETVNTQRDEGQKPPFNIIPEQLCGRAVEIKTPAIYIGIINLPSFDEDDGPWIEET